MRKRLSERQLSSEIQKLLPARLKVTSLQGRFEGKVANGTVRIYCSSDRKSFLSDFEAALSRKGDVTDLRLDGQSVKSRRFCEE